MIRFLATILVLSVLAGCATLPDVKYSYYPAKSKTFVSVTQVFDCNVKKKVVVYYSPAPVVETKYSSNRDHPPYTIETKALRSKFSDTDIGLGWFDDGRLKSVNVSTTGQGEAIIKAAVTALTAIGGAPESETDCGVIPELAAGKPIVVNYQIDLDYPPASGVSFPSSREIPPIKSSEAMRRSLRDALRDKFPKLSVRLKEPTALEPLIDAKSTETDLILTLNRQGKQELEVYAEAERIWAGAAVVPLSSTYGLPIPRSKAFGKQVFSVTLNESGGITAQGYGRAVGTASALNALSTAYGTVDPSDAAIAAAAKNEADVIAQTNRLAACRKDPAACK